MGDESIIAPPRWKNVRITGTSGASFRTSGGTLNVIHVPSPMTGNRSPLLGIGRVIGAPSAARPLVAFSVATAASDLRKSRREEGIARLPRRRNYHLSMRITSSDNFPVDIAELKRMG